MAIAYKCDISGEYMDEPKNGFVRTGEPISIEHGEGIINLTVDLAFTFQVPGSETNQFTKAVNNKIKKAVFQKLLIALGG